MIHDLMENKHLQMSHADKMSVTMESSNENNHNYGFMNKLGLKITKDLDK